MADDAGNFASNTEAADNVQNNIVICIHMHVNNSHNTSSSKLDTGFINSL